VETLSAHLWLSVSHWTVCQIFVEFGVGSFNKIWLIRVEFWKTGWSERHGTNFCRYFVHLLSSWIKCGMGDVYSKLLSDCEVCDSTAKATLFLGLREIHICTCHIFCVKFSYHIWICRKLYENWHTESHTFLTGVNELHLCLYCHPSCSWFHTFTMLWMLYSFFWVIPQHLTFMCRCSEHSVCSIFWTRRITGVRLLGYLYR